MLHRLEKGDTFKLNDEALDNYGEEFRDQIFTVEYWADHTVHSSKYFNPTSPSYKEAHGHPGYDEGVSPERLYGSDFKSDVYDWEITPV